MKFSVQSKALFNLASNVGRVINAKNAVTSLNNYLCTVEGNTLTLTGSDLENSLSGKVEIFDSWSDGTFQIDARRLTSLLKELAEQPLTISVNEENYEIEVATANGQYSMAGLSAEQYPKFKKGTDAEGETKGFLCSAEAILKGLDRTMFAVGSDDLHPQMTGILLDIKEDCIVFVATDTRKLVKYVQTSFNPGMEVSCIMPLKAANIIKGIFAKTDTVTVEIASNIGIIVSDTYTFVFSFIKGRYPDYNRVIPKNNPYAINVNRKELLNSIRRVNIFVDPGMGLVKAKITPDKLLLKSRASESKAKLVWLCRVQPRLHNVKSTDPNLLSQGNESVDCLYQGEEVVVGLSAPYLMDICNVIPNDDIVCNLSDPSRPLVFTPVQNAENEEFLALLMPMNVTEY